jgi:hypothetical protein
VRSPLVWLGEADPVASMERTRENDPELETMREFMDAWRATIGANNYKTAFEVAGMANGTTFGHSHDHPEFHEAVLKIAGRGGSIDIRNLGRWFTSHVDRIVDGWKFTKGPTARGGAIRYVLVPTNAARGADGGLGGSGGLVSNPSAKNKTSGIPLSCNTYDKEVGVESTNYCGPSGHPSRYSAREAAIARGRTLAKLHAARMVGNRGPATLGKVSRV